MISRDDIRWNKMFDLLREYVNTFYKFPQTNTIYKEENLGNWFRNQVSFYESDSLSIHRLNALNNFNPAWKESPELRKEEEKRLLSESNWRKNVSNNEIPIDEFFKDDQLYTCLSNGIYSCLDYLKFFEEEYGEDFLFTSVKMNRKYNDVFSVENRRRVYNKVFPNLHFDISNIIFPSLTTATHLSTAPLPDPIRTSSGLAVFGI